MPEVASERATVCQPLEFGHSRLLACQKGCVGKFAFMQAGPAQTHAVVFLVVSRRDGRPTARPRCQHRCSHVEEGNMEPHQVAALQQMLAACGLPDWCPGRHRRQESVAFWDDADRALARGFICAVMLCKLQGTRLTSVLSRDSEEIPLLWSLYPASRRNCLASFQIQDVAAMSTFMGEPFLAERVLRSDDPALLPFSSRREYQSSRSSFRREVLSLSEHCVQTLMAVPCCRGTTAMGTCRQLVAHWSQHHAIQLPALAVQFPPVFCMLFMKRMWRSFLLDVGLRPPVPLTVDKDIAAVSANVVERDIVQVCLPFS